MKEGRESRMEAQLGKTRRLTSCMCNFKRHHRALSPVPFLSPPSLHPSPVPPLSKSELFKERNRETGQDVVQLSVIRTDDSSSSRSWAEFRSIDKRSCNKVHLARLPWHIHITVYVIPHIAHWTSVVKSVTSITVMTVNLNTQGTWFNG